MCEIMNEYSDDNVCRICFQKQDTIFSLFRKQKGTSPYDKLVKNTKLKIAMDDGGPSSICLECLTDLDTTINFLNKCERSNQILAAKYTHIADKKEYMTFKGDSKNDVIPCISQEASTEYDVMPLKDHLERNEEKLHELLFVPETGQCPECGSKRRCKHWAPPVSHTCQYCQKVFTRKFNFMLHLKRHSGSREYACSCGARQLTRGQAARHCAPRARRACPRPGCGKTFTTNTNLNTHLRTHNGNSSHSGSREYACSCGARQLTRGQAARHCAPRARRACPRPGCGKTFTTNTNLNTHLRTHNGNSSHSGSREYACSCGARQLTRGQAARHCAPRARRACPRPGCGKTFTTNTNLNTHLRTHNGNSSHSGSREYACSCGARQLTRGQAARHCAPRARRACPRPGCGKTFTTNTNLNTHLRTHNGNSSHSGSREYACSCGARQLTRGQAARHCAPRARRACPRPGCGKTFTTNTNLNTHLRTHNGNSSHSGSREYACSCGARQLTRGQAARHCAPRARRACPRPGCGKTFTTNTNLNTHLRTHNGNSSHSGSREYACSCGARQLTRGQAARHCAPRARRACPRPGCGKTFTTNTNLNTHLRTHNGNSSHSGSREYACSCGARQLTRGQAARHCAPRARRACPRPGCGKTFTTNTNLNTHLRTHNGVKPYICPVCGKRFATNKLSSHMLSHTTVRPHACAAHGCARAFKSRRALTLHAATHAANRRVHACLVCGARYNHKQSLNKHMKKQHGEKSNAADGDEIPTQ